MQELNNLRIRHSMLLGAYVQLKNYFDCLERGYLGKLNPSEQTLMDNMRKNMNDIEKVLWDYFDREAEILGE